MVAIVFDVILLSVIVFCMAYYFLKGFAASIVSFLRVLLAILVSLIFSDMVAEVIFPAILRAVGEDAAIVNANAYYVAYAIAFVLVFIVAVFTVKVIECFFSKVLRHLPIIGMIDGVLGGCVGFVVGILFSALAVEVYAVLVVYVGGSFFNAEAIEGSMLAKYLYENNLFGLIFKLVA